MSELTDKLGIKPIEEFIQGEYLMPVCGSAEVATLQKQRDLLLELVVESITDNWNENGYLYGIDHIVLGLESVIGKKWEDFKDLL